MDRGLATELLLRKDGGKVDILRTRRLAWAWRYAGVQEAGNLETGRM